MNSDLVWGPRITVSDATQERPNENLRNLRDLSEETSLISLLGDVSEICKSSFFQISLRRCMRHLKDASDMLPCQLGNFHVFSGIVKSECLLKKQSEIGVVKRKRVVQYLLYPFKDRNMRHENMKRFMAKISMTGK